MDTKFELAESKAANGRGQNYIYLRCDQNWTVASFERAANLETRHKMAVSQSTRGDDVISSRQELLDSNVLVTLHQWHRIPGADHQT